MKVKGVFLKFDVLNGNYQVISKDCKIDIPDKVPILYNFDMSRPPIGFANVSRTNEGLILEGDIVSPYDEVISKMIKNNETIGAGGYYNHLKTDEKGSINEMVLRAVSYVEAPVNPDYKFEIDDDKNNENDNSND